MALTAANTMPVQLQQMQGQPQAEMEKPSAHMLMKKRGKKKPEPKDAAPPMQSGPPTANILMQRRK